METIKCEVCGKEIPIEEAIYYEKGLYFVCKECFENEFVECERCGRIICRNEPRWVSVEERLPERGDSIVMSLIYNGIRQYWVAEDAGLYLHDGKLIFGHSECDYWQPINLKID